MQPAADLFARQSRAGIRGLLVYVLLAISACSSSDEPAAPPAATDTAPASSSPKRSVTVYATVPPAQIRPVLEAYTAESGVKTELIVDDFPRLAPRIESAGSGPVADLVIAASLAELSDLSARDVLRPSYFAGAAESEQTNLSDPENVWHALSHRARVVVYDNTSVSSDELQELTGYESLADRAWRDRLCVSSSRVGDNLLLLASLIREHGLREAELTARGWMANSDGRFYRRDTDVLTALAAGECQVAITSSSALALYVSSSPDTTIVTHPFVGAHLVDIAAGAVSRHAENPEGAAALLGWLRKDAPNALFAISGYEFPVAANADVGAAVLPFAQFVTEPGDVAALAYLVEDAALLAERARYP